METEDSRQLVLDYLHAQASGDRSKVAELLADDLHWRPPQGGEVGDQRGRDQVLATMAELGPRFFDLASMQVEVKWIVAEGDMVIVRQRATGKAANRRDYDNEYVWVYVCRDGRIAEIEEHVDSKRFHDIVLAE